MLVRNLKKKWEVVIIVINNQAKKGCFKYDPQWFSHRYLSVLLQCSLSGIHDRLNGENNAADFLCVRTLSP